jgi:hypothetical protein
MAQQLAVIHLLSCCCHAASRGISSAVVRLASGNSSTVEDLFAEHTPKF